MTTTNCSKSEEVMKRGAAMVALAIATIINWPMHAADIMAEWGSVMAPTAPELKAVMVDPKTSALLMLDFVPQDPYCGPNKPRCGATLPAIKRLLTRARGKDVPVIYSVAGKFEAADIAKDIAPPQTIRS